MFADTSGLARARRSSSTLARMPRSSVLALLAFVSACYTRPRGRIGPERQRAACRFERVQSRRAPRCLHDSSGKHANPTRLEHGSSAPRPTCSCRRARQRRRCTPSRGSFRPCRSPSPTGALLTGGAHGTDPDHSATPGASPPTSRASACPAEMALVERPQDSFCIDRWEASLELRRQTGETRPGPAIA